MTPLQQQLRAAQAAAGLTNAQAASVANVSLPTWQRYTGQTTRPTDPPFCVLNWFLLATGQHPEFERLTPRKPVNSAG